MKASITSILDVKISASTRSEILFKISNYLKSKTDKLLTIFTPNPEQVVLAQKDNHFREVLNSADIALPDGSGLKLGSVHLEIIPGIEFMEDLCAVAANEGYRVVLIGGREGVAQKALVKLQQKFARLNGWADTSPEFRIQNTELQIPNRKSNTISRHAELVSASPIIEILKQVRDDMNELDIDSYFGRLAKRIKESGAKVVFVGLGAPKQEYFIQNLKSQISNHKNPLILMSVGGAFDELSGRIKRAPQWVSRLGLKWLWRLFLEPWRIKRQMKLLVFVGMVLKKRLGW